jgi:hypothetical protein
VFGHLNINVLWCWWAADTPPPQCCKMCQVCLDVLLHVLDWFWSCWAAHPPHLQCCRYGVFSDDVLFHVWPFEHQFLWSLCLGMTWLLLAAYPPPLQCCRICGVCHNVLLCVLPFKHQFFMLQILCGLCCRAYESHSPPIKIPSPPMLQNV